ncbi:MAG: sigma 54-interacting transcriptional regulator [Polyangiaceae bacterium]
MPRARGRALVIDADPAIRRGVARALAERDIEPLTAEDSAAGIALLHAQAIDVALVDVGEDGDGIDAAMTIAREQPGVAIVLVSPPARAAAALDAAWSIGADLLKKPLEPLAIAALFAARALDRKRAEGAARAHDERAAKEIPVELSGVSEGITSALRLASEAARTTTPVLVVGEEGTGRDRIARLVHDRSRRSARPFVSLSCAELADDPEGARLFGTTDGATLHEGLADTADRGTLFLDAIERLPIGAQDRLIALLGRGLIRRVGSSRTDPDRGPADVRVIAGASADLRDRVRGGAMREELYYRLRAIEIRLPPLRDRPEDVPLLAYAWLRSIREETGRDVRRIGAEALRLMRRHPWPGNAREMGSALAHAAALARGDSIAPADLPFAPKIPDAPPDGLFDDELSELSYNEARRRALVAFEERYTRLAIAREGGNLSGAARRAGMDRSNFKRLLKRKRPPPE